MTPEQPSPDVLWSGLTHPGRVRPNNEDVFLALALDAREVRFLGKTGRAPLAASDFIFAVSDGMGGAKSGEFASRIAVDRITRLLPAALRGNTSAAPADFSAVLGDLVAAIHRDLLRLGYSYEECAGMGATLTLAWVRQDRMHFAHVGDSRLYHLPAGGPLIQLSHDHSYPGWLRRQGQLNEREARTHPRRNALSQALGAGNQFVDPQLGEVAHRPGDRFLLCSDGVIDGLWDRQLEELLGTDPAEPDPRSRAHRLVEEAVALSGRDNTTAVVFELGAP
ncbi:MAG: protein phosphatase 2C domain-containing protein [Opitutaceae bacterium]|nr:protein phosphatase 2C domain-containing protein [Opitutaceae bacterium]